MQLIPILFSPFFTNGNDMFNLVQKDEWQRFYPYGENNVTKWALRSLLIKEGNTELLIDSGFSNLFSKDLDDYCVKEYKTPEQILGIQNAECKSITHLLYTHLHIDHCGGGFVRNSNDEIRSLFTHAQIIVSTAQLESAQKPTQFEASSFQREIVDAIANSKVMDKIESPVFLFPWLELNLFHGHTKGLIIPVIHFNKKSIAFVGDLIPSVAHLILQCSMSYDINPLLSLAERDEFLEEAYENEYILFFQHDFYNECCSLKKENNRIVVNSCFKLEDVLNSFS